MTTLAEILHFPIGDIRRQIPGLPARGEDEVIDRMNDSLMTAADRGEFERDQDFLRQIAWCPRQRRHELRKAMTTCAQTASVRLPDGGEGEALLLRMPLLVLTDHAIDSLTEDALHALNASLHQHGLLGHSTQVLFLPWLEPEGSEVINLVSRRRLLLELVLHLVRSRTYPLPGIHLEPPAPVAIQERGTHTRYVTLAMIGAGIELQSVTDGWQTAGDSVRQWSTHVGNLIKAAGGHELVAASLPTAYAQAGMKGGLHRGAFEIKRFLLAMRRESGAPPGECEMQLIPSLAGDNGLGLRYLHDGRLVGEVSIAKPYGCVICSARDAGEALSRTARNLCEAIGIRRFTELRQPHSPAHPA